MSAYNEFQNLPGTPDDGDLVFYDPPNGGRFLLEWDDSLGEWFCISTRDQFREIPITKNGSVNKNLLAVSDNGNPLNVTVNNGNVFFEADQTNTRQTWVGTCGFSLRKGSILTKGNFNAQTAPTNGFIRAGWFQGRDFETYNAESLIILGGAADYRIKIDEYSNAGNFVTAYLEQSGIDTSATHTVEIGTNQESIPTELAMTGRTTTSSGSTSSGDIFQTSFSDPIKQGLYAESSSDHDSVNTIVIESIELKV